jgi:uroporphyrinogen-III synthase
MRLLVTRPADDARAIAQALIARGHDVVVDPVLTIVPATDEVPDLKGVQAVLATSANGVRALARLGARREVPLLAVGRATADAARAADFGTVLEAEGDVVSLARLAAARFDPRKGPLVHAAGSDVAGDLKGLLEAHGFTVRRHVLYAARASEALGAETRKSLADGALDGALFFSPRSAKVFLGLVEKAQLKESLGRLVAYCLSPAVAAEARRAPFAALRVAERPAIEALLTVIDAEAEPAYKP